MGVAGLDVFLVGVELEGLLVDHLLQEIPSRLEVIPGPVEWLLAFRLSFLIVQAFEIGVLETLLDCVALFRVEDEHLAQEVEGHRVCLGVE